MMLLYVVHSECSYLLAAVTPNFKGPNLPRYLMDADFFAPWSSARDLEISDISGMALLGTPMWRGSQWQTATIRRWF